MSGFRPSSTFELNNPNNYKIFKDQEVPIQGRKFTDPLFPPDSNSLLGKNLDGTFIDPENEKHQIINPENIEWKRSTEIFAEPQLYEGTISMDDVKQGSIQISYFLSALSSMCEFPRLISNIILSKETNEDGIYQVLLFIDGEYQIVLLDDYFPCIKGTNLLYFSKPNSFELWVLLLEKAWAKVNGGYANILSGWSSEVFRALTSFPCEKLIHPQEENIDRVWGIIRTVDLNNGLICSTTLNDDSIEEKGLIKNHTYTLIDTEEVTDDKGNKIRLCKMKNPWDLHVWNGDWGKESSLWSDEIKKQIDDKNLKDDIGTFWISIEDLNKYFVRSDLCQIIYGGNVKIINLNEDDLQCPLVYNIYVSKPGLLSVNLIEKNWRYNRELKHKPHPSSLILAEYDPSTKKIKHAFTDFECYQDTEKTRKVHPGFYILWIYKCLDASVEPKPKEAKLRICCDVPYNLKQIGQDKDFNILGEIICEGVKHHHEDQIKEDEFYYEIKNSFGNSGISYRLIINPQSNKYEEWENDASKIKGIMLLPPYQNKDKFNFTVGPKSYGIVLGIKKDVYGDHWFNIISKLQQFECKEGESPSSFQKPKFEDFCTEDVSNPETESTLTSNNTDYPTLEDLSTVDEYRKIDHKKFWENKLKEKYPKIMEEILKLPPIETDKKLDFIELKTNNGFYIGEADHLTRYGRGAYIYEKEGLIFIGYWDNNEKEKSGKLFKDEYNNLKLIYDGEYKNGLREGKGVYYFNGGEIYDGKFKGGNIEGKGTITWEDGTKWTGKFKDNLMDGKGKYFDGKETLKVAYKKGEVV